MKLIINKKIQICILAALILYVFTDCVKLQNNVTQKNLPGQPIINKIYIYNSTIYEAEQAIINNDPEHALERYTAAFELKEDPFAIDLYNAFICALKLNKANYTERYALLLSKLGLTTQEIKLLYSENRMTPDPDFLEKCIYQEKEYDNSDLLALRDTIIKLLERDQAPRSATYPVYTNKQEIKTNDEAIELALFNLISDYGYPDEYKIGLRAKSETALSFNSPLHVIIRHAYQNKSQLLDSILYNSMKSGKIKPEEYTSWLSMSSDIDLSGRCTPGNEALFLINDSLIYKCHVDSSRLHLIENNRSEFNLPSYGLQVERSLFSIKNKEFKISQFGSYAIIYQSQESLNQLINNLKLELVTKIK